MKVFLRYYVELPFPAGRINDVIARLPGEWLDRAAGDANLRGLLLLGAPAFTADPELTTADVCVSLSAPQAEGTLLRRAVEWLAVRDEGSEPVLRGDLELAELGPSRTQLALSAQYRPFATAQQTADRAAAQRIAESTLKDFVDRLADYIQLILGGIPAGPINPAEQWPSVEQKGRSRVGRGWLAAS